MVFFFFKQKTAYELRISDWSSDVCSSDLPRPRATPDIACLERLGGQIGDLAAPIILPLDLDRERPVIERDHAIGIARLDRVEQRLVRPVGIALGGLAPRIEPVARDAGAV